MNKLFSIPIAMAALTFATMGEEGTTPRPSEQENSAPVKASQVELKKDKGTTATTQDAQSQTNRAPNSDAIPATPSKTTDASTQDAQSQTNRAPNNEPIPHAKSKLPEYDSDGATKRENDKRDRQKE